MITRRDRYITVCSICCTVTVAIKHIRSGTMGNKEASEFIRKESCLQDSLDSEAISPPHTQIVKSILGSTALLRASSTRNASDRMVSVAVICSHSGWLRRRRVEIPCVQDASQLTVTDSSTFLSKEMHSFKKTSQCFCLPSSAESCSNLVAQQKT
ncbi:hypothetical protein Tcan_00759, partial [Toxocara canis]